MTENHPPESTPPEAEQPAPDEERPDGERPDGERPDGERPDGERPDGERPDGERPDGERPDGEPAEDPGYLTETGEAAGEDGSVVPIIGGLPAAEGSAWDIGAPADERGAALAEHEAGQEHQDGQEDPR